MAPHPGRSAMKSSNTKVLVLASIMIPAAALAQSGSAPTTATYIMKEEFDKILATQQSVNTSDQNAKIVDLGYETFAVGMIHRNSTRNPLPAAPAAGAAAAAA